MYQSRIIKAISSSKPLQTIELYYWALSTRGLSLCTCAFWCWAECFRFTPPPSAAFHCRSLAGAARGVFSSFISNPQARCFCRAVVGANRQQSFVWVDALLNYPERESIVEVLLTSTSTASCPKFSTDSQLSHKSKTMETGIFTDKPWDTWDTIFVVTCLHSQGRGNAILGTCSATHPWVAPKRGRSGNSSEFFPHRRLCWLCWLCCQFCNRLMHAQMCSDMLGGGAESVMDGDLTTEDLPDKSWQVLTRTPRRLY